MKKVSDKKGSNKIMAIIAILIILAMVLSCVVPIFASTYNAASSSMVYYEMTGEVTEGTTETKLEEEDKAIESDTLEVNVSVGYDDVYMVNRQTPLKLTVYNNGEDFKGIVEIKAYTNIDAVYSPSTYVKYTKEIDIVSGGAGEYDFTIFPQAPSSYINVKILDSNGNLELSFNKSVKPITPEEIMTAVLTDSKSGNLDYLSNLKIGEDIHNRRASTYKTNYVSFLNQKSFPENAEVLSSFSAVIIDDFNSKSLSDKQKKALTTWTENGGLLIIGTGLNAEKTLNGLEDVFDFNFKGYGTTLCFGGEADTADIEIEGANETEIQGGKAVTKTLNLGDGKIIVHSFDLGTDPVASMGNKVEYFSEFYRNTMPEKFSADRNYYYHNDMINSVNRLPSIEKGRLMTLLGILAIYIIVVGPICYLILRKKDKREKGWVTIPVIAVVFSVIIFGVSSSSYQKEALVNFMSYTDLDSAKPTTQISVGIRTPEKGDITLSLDDNVYVYNNGVYYPRGYGDVSKSICGYAVSNDDNSTEITYFDQNSWADNSFNTSIDYGETNSLDGQFTVNGSNITGTITNNFDYDLFDVVIGFAGQYQKVGRIEAGGSIEVSIPLSAEEYNKWNDNSYELIRQMFYGLEENMYQDSMVFRTGMSATEAYKTEQRFNLFRSIVFDGGYDLREKGFEVTVAAFSEKRLIDGEKRINGKAANENWENMYVKTFETELSASDSYDIPAGYIFPDEIYLNNETEDSQLDLNYYQLYTMSSDYLRCTYDLSFSDNIKSMDVIWDNYDAFREEPQIYNYDKEAWENLKDADLVNNPNQYVSKDRKIMLGAEVYSDTYVTLPKLSLKGGR